MREKCCINVFDDGPLGVERLETLTNFIGDELEVNRKMALCRCGASQINHSVTALIRKSIFQANNNHK